MLAPAERALEFAKSQKFSGSPEARNLFGPAQNGFDESPLKEILKGFPVSCRQAPNAFRKFIKPRGNRCAGKRRFDWSSHIV